ncbi:MAG: SDR family oxidoreductase [Planctomycetes bacterium]|nr:SDR family oxidoreductase [Planctomycetota bacterium]
MNKILVTGGCGFIGSHLCKRLLESSGNQVICLDNLFTGNTDNIQSYYDHKNFTFIQADVLDAPDIAVDQIYNLACPASPVHYQFNPVQTTKTSVLGALQMLELAQRYNAKILQSSTSEVYGDPVIHPQVESYWGNVNPIGIRSCYDEGKRCAESLFFDFHRQYGLEIKVARIFNTYGPNMHPNDGRVVSNFITQALDKKDITLFGDGSQTRSFCYVDDLVEGLIQLMASPRTVTGPMNLGNPNEFTIRQLAEKIIALCNPHSQIIEQPLPADDPKQRKPDISLAQNSLQWQPQIQLNEGLKATVDYFSQIIAVDKQ